MESTTLGDDEILRELHVNPRSGLRQPVMGTSPDRALRRSGDCILMYNFIHQIKRGCHAAHPDIS